MCKLQNCNWKNGRKNKGILGRGCYKTKREKRQDFQRELRLNSSGAEVDEQNRGFSPFKGLSPRSSSKLGVELSTEFIRDANVFISWDEIQNMELFSRGTYGKIYKATYDYMEVAVKVMSVPWDQLSDKQRQEFMLEIRTAIQVSQHKNV